MTAAKYVFGWCVCPGAATVDSDHQTAVQNPLLSFGVSRPLKRDALSSEIQDRFEDHYAGRVVTWQGDLSGSFRYSYDRIFGNEPGTRATVVVGEVETRYGSLRKIQAVVQFPEDAADDLRYRHGERLRFTGTLRAVDPLLRSMHIADAVLG